MTEVLEADFVEAMRKASSLTIDSRSIGKGVHPFEFSPSAEAIGLDPQGFHSVEVEGTLQISAARMVVDLVASAVAILECDRTLAEFEQEISGSFNGIVGDASEIHIADEDGTGGSSQDGDGRTLSAADLSDIAPMFDGVIVLDSVVRDTLILAVPLRKISPEAAAMELQTEFRFDADDGDEAENVDPRWEALLRLKEAGLKEADSEDGSSNKGGNES